MAAAARGVLVIEIARIGAPFPPSCASGGIARAEADYANALATIADGAAKTQGIALGQARSVSASQNLDAWQNARLFGLLNVALADGYIASWATKYHYRFWRPVTAIREAANDGNPGTTADAAWMSLVPTPPIPDYESAHSVQGAAAAQVMKRVFGRDNIAFSACSLTLPAGSTCNDANPVRRRFRGFDHAADENGVSRILVGFHFRDAVEKGLGHGRRIGEWAFDQTLKPLR